MLFRDAGIKHKMLIAFSLVLASTLLASAIALFAFSRLSESMDHITQRVVPVMEESMIITKLGIKLSSLLPSLASATTLERKDELIERVRNAEDTIEEILQNGVMGKIFEQTETDHGHDHVIDTSHIHDDRLIGADFLAQQRQLINDLDEKISDRINTQIQTETLINTVTEVQLQIDKDLQALINSAKTDVQRLTDDTLRENESLTSNMLDSHLNGLFNALRLKVQIADVSIIMLNSLSVNATIQFGLDSKTIQPLFNSINSYSETLRSQNPSAFSDIDNELKTLENIASTTSGIYTLPYAPFDDFQRKELSDTIRTKQTKINEILDTVADHNHTSILNTATQLDSRLSDTLPLLANGVLESLVSMVQLRAETNTLAGLLAQVPQISSSHMQTLEKRYVTTWENIVVLTDSLKDVIGFDSVESGIFSLRNSDSNENALFRYRNRVLESERSIALIEQSLSEIQARFVDHLAEDVQVNRAQVTMAGESISQLISRSRILLVLVSALGIAFTILVFWLLVSRNVIVRLLEIIKALRSLANGNTDVTVNSSGNDELSDLARTVDVFKNNAIESLRLQNEQKELENEKHLREDEQRRAEKLLHEAETERYRIEQESAREKQQDALDLQRRVDSLLVAVNAAASGDLNHPIDVTGNDVASQMGEALKTLFAELRSSMSGISDNASLLATASESLKVLSGDMNNIAKTNTENSRKASEMADAVDSNVTKVSDSTTLLNSSIAKIVSSSTEAENVALEAVDLTRQTDVTVRKLAESSQGIGSVIKVITSIAEQTNLLALNATIEAARAGEAGKGFAVVANEVKELAKETAKATEQIESRIGDIQADTTSAVDAIHSISEIIARINIIQSSIAAAIDEQTDVSQEITHSIGQTTVGTSAISSVIDVVADKARLSQQASHEVSTAAADLSSMSAQLQQLVGRFTHTAPGNSLKKRLSA